MASGSGINAHFRRVTGAGFSSTDKTGLATPEAVANWLETQKNAFWEFGDRARVTGGATQPETGAGIELSFSGGQGSMLTYDRDQQEYVRQVIVGAPLKLEAREGQEVKIAGTIKPEGETVWSGSSQTVDMTSLAKQGNGIYLVSNGNHLLPVIVDTGSSADPQTTTLVGGYFYRAVYSSFNEFFRMKRRSATSLSDSDTNLNIEKIIKL